MKIIEKMRWSGGGDPVEFAEVERTYGEKWVLVKLKKMTDLMLENDYWFDIHGNFCTAHGQICPTYFSNLGREFHAKEGCGWTLSETDWLKRD